MRVVVISEILWATVLAFSFWGGPWEALMGFALRSTPESLEENDKTVRHRATRREVQALG